MAASKGHLFASALLAGVTALSATSEVGAQELEARAFSAAPVGTRFVIAGLGHSDGAYVLDPAVPIGDVEADVDFATLGGGFTFALFDRQARILAIFPYASGDISGDTSEGGRQTEQLEGLVDPRIKFSIGLIGAPALSMEAFASRERTTVVGASLTVMPPLGQYDGDRLVNLGYNRWGLKPEIGVSHPIGDWTFEGSAGVWLFTDNDDYQGGLRAQDPIGAVQTHVAYTFDNGAWLAADATWFSGGRTAVDGLDNDDGQANARAGLTLSWPIARGQSLKFTYSTGMRTRRGSDFDTLNVTWQAVMF